MITRQQRDKRGPKWRIRGCGAGGISLHHDKKPGINRCCLESHGLQCDGVWGFNPGKPSTMGRAPERLLPSSRLWPGPRVPGPRAWMMLFSGLATPKDTKIFGAKGFFSLQPPPVFPQDAPGDDFCLLEHCATSKEGPRCSSKAKTP